jgi:hypothetical protein
MDPYAARQDAIEKMLPEELEAQSHNTDMCDSETNKSDMSDSDYVPSEHFDQEECDRVSTRETASDGDNVTATYDNDTDSATDGGYEAKKWTNLE